MFLEMQAFAANHGKHHLIDRFLALFPFGSFWGLKPVETLLKVLVMTSGWRNGGGREGENCRVKILF
jgi:hypothetical protein